jgi:phosphohistidine phosphatase
MGSILKKLKVAPDLVISSPANRAATTARIIADSIDYPLEKIQYDETIYGSSESDLVQAIRQLDNAVNQAMLVSHNPALTDLANTIGDTAISNIPTCGVCGVNLNISSWVKIGEQRGKLRLFEFPKKHTS